MDRATALRPPLLTLKTSPKELEVSRCTRCYEPHSTQQACRQRQRQRIPRSLPPVPSSDFASYTARICPSTPPHPKSPLSPSSVSSDGDANSTLSSPTPSIIKVRCSKDGLPSTPPALRRKISPTQTSLRDIRASQQLQMKRSEDQLRQLYERQTMEYLYGDFASLDGLQE